MHKPAFDGRRRLRINAQTAQKASEIVLAIPAEAGKSHLFKDNPFQPPQTFTLTDLVAQAEQFERNSIENNPCLLQLVTYTIIVDPDRKKIFTAKRIAGDRRLLNSYCIGFGGHVNIDDVKLNPVSLSEKSAIYNTAIRELREELYIAKKNLELNLLGFVRDVNSSSSEHLGIVYYVTLSRCSIREKDKLSGAWVSYEKFKDSCYPRLESWSKYIFDYIYSSEKFSREFALTPT